MSDDDLERLRRDDPELAEKLELLRQWCDAVKREHENETLLRLDTEANEASPTFLYQPDTAHPAYARQAAAIRRYMSEGRKHVLLPKPMPISMLFAGGDPGLIDSTLDVETLIVKRAWAAAPYVGRPFIYVWDVAVDKVNRWVSGSAEMRYI